MLGHAAITTMNMAIANLRAQLAAMKATDIQAMSHEERLETLKAIDAVRVSRRKKKAEIRLLNDLVRAEKVAAEGSSYGGGRFVRLATDNDQVAVEIEFLSDSIKGPMFYAVGSSADQVRTFLTAMAEGTGTDLAGLSKSQIREITAFAREQIIAKRKELIAELSQRVAALKAA